MPPRLEFLIPVLLLANQKLVAYGSNDGSDHGSGDGHFDYKNTDSWATDVKTCGGSRQSPIDLILQDVQIMEPKPPLQRFGYDNRPQTMTLTNNGHSVQLSGQWPDNRPPTVYGGPLRGMYEFAQLHFHWGASNDVGSEHTVGNQSYPLEMHLVHYKKSYGNLSEALKHDDGVTVIGYIMSLDKNVNMGIEKIRSGFSKIVDPGETVQIDPFPLSLFNLELKEGIVTYLGSLTTPPCTESVIWILAVRVKDITIDELGAFRKLKLNHGDDHNYRPTQSLNERTVFYLNDNIVN